MTSETDILIIGGGISGLLSARELVLAGRTVTVIDKSDIGQEASWAGGGILLPIYPWRQADAISRLVRISLQSYPKLSRELIEATAIDPEWRPCGMLICKNPDLEQAAAWCNAYNIGYSSPESAQLQNLNTTFEHPLWLPGIAQARNPRLLKSLKTYLQQHSVRFVTNALITKVAVENNSVKCVQTQAGNFKPKHVAVCTGAWTAEFLQRWLPSTAVSLPITPVRGQMLLFDARPDTLLHMVLDGDHYLIPRRDGKILAGSTVEQAGFEKATTEAARQKLYRFATELLPDLKNYAVCAHWAGLRPGTPDGVPYIGLHPEIENLSVNAGHFRNGLVMGPASAQLMADLILQRPPVLDPMPYALSRK